MKQVVRLSNTGALLFSLSVRHSIKADGNTCCSHLVPKQRVTNAPSKSYKKGGCTCLPGNVSHQKGCPHWVMPY